MMIRAFHEQRSNATKIIAAKTRIQNKHDVSYKQIRQDFISQMGSMQRKRKTEIAHENMRLYKKI